MKQVDVVIGANYGDEGKGNVTNHLVDKNCAVVRFNGGAQAAHTVEHGDIRHVFHSVGSGTLKGAPTILGPKFAIDPIMFFREAEELFAKTGEKLKVFADPKCPIVTPFDIMINQAAERKRGNDKHGSCGMGFGETIRRNKSGYPFILADIETPYACTLKKIEQYSERRMKELGLEADQEFLQQALTLFLKELESFSTYVEITPFSDSSKQFDRLVFEGAQGLCLDQDSEDFPHVTYSNTGLDNVMELLDQNTHWLNLHYVTRTYLTRHGAGKLDNEHDQPDNVVDETNAPNEFQGALRFAPLNIKRMMKDINHDICKARMFSWEAKLMITCCDQIDPEPSLLGLLPDYETCWSAAGGFTRKTDYPKI